MNLWNRVKRSLAGVGQSLIRYPLTAFWLVCLAVVNAVEVEHPFDSYDRWLFTLLVGAIGGVVAEHLYERFLKRERQRWILLLAFGILAVVYYFLLPGTNFGNIVYFLRSLVLIFALFIASVWIPSIRNERVYFHQMFLANVKSMVISLLFSLVLTAGVGAIIGAVDQLLFAVDFRFMTHVANIIWSLFAPLYFLSLLPDERKQAAETPERISDPQTEKLETPFTVPRFLELLLSYIIIPVVAIYTVILLLYVILNMGSEFWTDNLLEPLLVSYAVAVTIIYLLSCNVKNKIVAFFQKVFPKVMLLIVLFQTIASVLKIQQMGITHGRYYVILFGVFAIFSAFVFSFFPPSKNGWIAVVLLVLSFISITPPMDAFTVARNSQSHLLERTLLKNKMVENREVIPKKEIPVEDKVKITRSVIYLYDMDAMEQAKYLPKTFQPYYQMERTFGFPLTYSTAEETGQRGRTAFFEWDHHTVVSVDSADYLIRFYLSPSEEELEPIQIQEESGETYVVKTEYTNPYYRTDLLDEEGDVVLSLELEELFQQAFQAAEEKASLSQEDMSLSTENEKAELKVLAVSLEEYAERKSGDLFLFIRFK